MILMNCHSRGEGKHSQPVASHFTNWTILVPQLHTYNEREEYISWFVDVPERINKVSHWR